MDKLILILEVYYFQQRFWNSLTISIPIQGTKSIFEKLSSPTNKEALVSNLDANYQVIGYRQLTFGVSKKLSKLIPDLWHTPINEFQTQAKNHCFQNLKFVHHMKKSKRP